MMAHRPIAKLARYHRQQPVWRGACASSALAASAVLLFVASLLGGASPAGATMYKWVDEKGQTVYSDQPPPSSVKLEIVKPPPPPANPNAVKEMVNADTEMKQREKQRIEKAKEAEKTRADAEKRQEMCAAAQGRIKALQRADLYRFDAKGERVYLDPDTRRRETEEQQKLVRENCA